MRSADGYRAYLDGCSLPKEDREIIAAFIEQRNAVKPTATRTKGKQAYECTWIAENLAGAALSSCTVHDLLKAAGAASSGEYTKNSRQTKIMTLKVLARYIHRFHHEIPNLDLLTQDVKAGTAESDTKDLITVDEWHQLINTPMPARDKAMVAMLYDGYHRPKEILILKWSDLQVLKDGSIQYVIRFKTGIPRTIAQKEWTTKILKAWAKESGAKIGESPGPVFPSSLTGDHYHTIEPLVNLCERLREKTGIKHLIPSVFRNSALKHDADEGMPVSYMCLRAWGVTYNKMINIYMKPDSGKIQADQHRKSGKQESPIIDEEENDRLSKLERKIKDMERSQRLAQKYMEEHLEKTN